MYWTIAWLALAATPALAEESLFGRTFTADTAEAGEIEFLLQSRNRQGRAFGNYDAVDVNASVEYGFSDEKLGIPL